VRISQADPDHSRNVAVWIGLVEVVYPAHDPIIITSKGSSKRSPWIDDYAALVASVLTLAYAGIAVARESIAERNNILLWEVGCTESLAPSCL
jgi:hypothetical protein